MIASLVFTTLLASFAAAGSDFTFNTPKNLIQCENATVSWTGGKAPFSVSIFTSDCDDGVDTPITTEDNVAKSTMPYFVNYYSGKGVFAVVDDADGNSYTSDDWYIGGDASKIGACQDTIKALVLAQDAAASSSSVASTASVTDSVAGSVPTTMSHSGSATITGNGVANAVKVTSSHAATATGLKPNGASSVRPMKVAAGIVGAAVAMAALL